VFHSHHVITSGAAALSFVALAVDVTIHMNLARYEADSQHARSIPPRMKTIAQLVIVTASILL
jgi:hypothetical protein